MNYPTLLTTSDWVDLLEQPNLTRDDKIAALATYHRRIDYEARQSVLQNLSNPDPKIHSVLVDAANAIAKAIPAPADYVAGDQTQDVATVNVVNLVDITPITKPPVN